MLLAEGNVLLGVADQRGLTTDEVDDETPLEEEKVTATKFGDVG